MKKIVIASYACFVILTASFVPLLVYSSYRNYVGELIVLGLTNGFFTQQVGIYWQILVILADIALLLLLPLSIKAAKILSSFKMLLFEIILLASLSMHNAIFLTTQTAFVSELPAPYSFVCHMLLYFAVAIPAILAVIDAVTPLFKKVSRNSRANRIAKEEALYQRFKERMEREKRR